MATADSIANPLERPKAVDKVTIAIPAAPCNAHVNQRNQKLLVRILSVTLREPLNRAGGFSSVVDSGLPKLVLFGTSVNWAAVAPTTAAMIANVMFMET